MRSSRHTALFIPAIQLLSPHQQLDAVPMADTFTAQKLSPRQQADPIPMADRFSVSVELFPVTMANKPKLLARPRWLFDADIGGTRKYSSEDMEKP